MVSLLNPSSNLLEFTVDGLNLLFDNTLVSLEASTTKQDILSWCIGYRKTAPIKSYCSIRGVPHVQLFIL